MRTVATVALLISILKSYATLPLTTCDFENSDPLCGFTQDTTDDFDWIRIHGPTATAGSGPMMDHTYGQQYSRHGHYMYAESSYPRKLGDKGRLISPVYTETSQLCLRFYFSMYGENMGTLNVFAKTGGNYGVPALTMSGDHGTGWKLANVTIPVSTVKLGFEIVFEGIIGSGYRGDIAIDDISIIKGQCNSTDSGAIIGR